MSKHKGARLFPEKPLLFTGADPIGEQFYVEVYDDHVRISTRWGADETWSAPLYLDRADTKEQAT